ncbi:uncharacterized protein LOC134818830 isoform X2 [Bolinopsis microptera]|uniref:uncharacterized protein LOC134818830 isoform X2 n=1 Tax=Bolinopsis microptera TaxID=2820187 RepID=UPI003079A28E
MSSPEVRGYPIGGLSDLSPPPTATSPWKHELQSTCSEDSALHSDSDNLQEDSLVSRVRKQLEYYFSLENLSSDQYLISQMDGDQFVPIWTVANFNAVKKLTTDIEVIKEALHSSTEVQIDSTGSKVRPVIKRCTLILRDISQHATAQEIAGLFNNSSDCPPSIKCTFAHNNSWFVEFRTEHEALQAYSYFREHPHYFHGDLIKVRIKAKPIQRSSPTDSNPVAYNSALYQGSMPCYPAMLPMMWMPPSGMVPMDHVNYPAQGGYPNNVPDHQDLEDHRYRVRSADSANYTNRRKPRRNNSSRSGGSWRHSDVNNRDRYSRSNNNTYHRHKRNDSDDSSTVSSASSYNVPPPTKHGALNKSPAAVPNNNSTAKRSASQANNKQTPSSGKHLQNKSNAQNKPPHQFNSNRQTLHNHKKAAVKQQQQPQPPALEKDIVPLKIQTKVPINKPPEKHIDLEPSQFPPLSSNPGSDVVKVSTAWCKRNDKPAEPISPKSDNSSSSTPPRVSGPLSPTRNQMTSRGGGTAARGAKYGPRTGQFRADSYYNRGTRRVVENHVSADTSINWRRSSQGSKPSRAMRPMRRSNKSSERRETDFVPDINIKAVSTEDFSNRPSYSEMAAKSSGNESDPSPGPVCNGNADSSSEEDSNKAYRKTFSEVITAQQNSSNVTSPPDHVTVSRRSESSDYSAQSPTTPKNEVVKSEIEETVWTKSTYRSPKPKAVNLKNVYKLETKLNDLDISEPVFPAGAPTEVDSGPSNSTIEEKESDNLTTPKDIITLENTPFKAAINWFDDDDDFQDDDFLIDSITNCVEETLTNCVVENEVSNDLRPQNDLDHVLANDIAHVDEDCHLPENCLNEADKETPAVEDSNVALNCVENCQPEVVHKVYENGDGGEEAETTETLGAKSPMESECKKLCASPKPDIFLLEDPPKGPGFEAEVSAVESKVVLSPENEEDHDSEYDSERDEFYSSYCESPGWE